MFARRRQQARAEGMHVLVAQMPPGTSPAGATREFLSTSEIAIGKIIADGAQVEIDSQTPEQKPLLFLVQKLAIDSISPGRPLSFRAVVKPEPPGDVSFSGQFGRGKRETLDDSSFPARLL